MNRRHFLYTTPWLAVSCGTLKSRKASNPFEGRWEGKLENGLSSLTVQFDFIPRNEQSMEFRINARDLFLATHLLETWRLDGNRLQFDVPMLEGVRSYKGYFGGNTLDLEGPGQEKIHLRRLGRTPALPYTETGLADMTPTARSVRAKAKVMGQAPVLQHFYADLLARLGIATSVAAPAGGGWLITEDLPLPAPPKENPPTFLMLLSPGKDRIREILEYTCPLFVLLGEADPRFSKLERGARQIAFDLREGLTRQKRNDYQISVIPKADQTLRVQGFEREYPRLTPQHLEYFRRFLSRFEPTPTA